VVGEQRFMDTQPKELTNNVHCLHGG
jgi:hypothetical protein